MAGPAELDEPAVVHDAVHDRGRELVVGEDRAPPAELDVGREYHAPSLVALGDHLMEKLLTACWGSEIMGGDRTVAVAHLEQPCRLPSGVGIVLQAQVIRHKDEPPISCVQEMGGSSIGAALFVSPSCIFAGIILMKMR